MKPIRNAVSTIFGLVLLLSGVAAQNVSRTTWAGMYFGEQKMGYTRITLDSATFRDKPATIVKSLTVVQLELLGNSVGQNIESTTYVDSLGALLQQQFKMSSSGALTQITADYQPDKILCTVKSGGSTSSRTVRIPPGATIISDATTGVLVSKLAARGGDFLYLNPLTLALEKLHIVLKGRESVTLAGKTYSALRIQSTMPLGSFTSWETDTGELLRAEMPLGMVMVREEPALAQSPDSEQPEFQVNGPIKAASASVEAPSLPPVRTPERSPARSQSAPRSAAKTPGKAGETYQPPSDFALATAVSIEKPIENPRSVKRLRMKVSGISDKSLAISDSRQHVFPIEDEDETYVYSIQAESEIPGSGAELPITNPALELYIQPAPYLEIDDPDIKAAAEKIRGAERNSLKVAQSIRKWIHTAMKPDYTIGVPRSCADIIKRQRGVCRDYATLFAGLARAAGVPTRLASGITFAQGKFFYHAWVECWVGKWVAFDATLPDDFVDATHVKFSHGDVTEMFNVANVVGKLKLTDVKAE